MNTKNPTLSPADQFAVDAFWMGSFAGSAWVRGCNAEYRRLYARAIRKGVKLRPLPKKGTRK